MKKSYVAPQLKVYGSVEVLTEGAGTGKGDLYCQLSSITEGSRLD